MITKLKTLWDVHIARQDCLWSPASGDKGDAISRGVISAVIETPKCTSHLGSGLAYLLRGYDLGKRFDQSGHTIENIWLAWDQVFEEHEDAVAAMSQFAEYLVLDAVIGNTDRHHENWGVVRLSTVDGWKGCLAPSFDHASSLGRELMDERRNGLLANSRVVNYSEKGIGGIYWSEYNRRAPSPLELVRKAFREYPSQFEPALSKLAQVQERDFSEIVSRIPTDWMSDAARRFAIRLISCNCRQLQEIQ